MVWRALGRLILVPIAFLAAAAIATLVAVTLGLERITHAIQGKGEGALGIEGLVDLLLEGRLLASGLTLLPALAVAIVGEVARIRSSVYYIVGGGAALAAIPLIARIGEAGDLVLPAAAVWQVLATAGFAGGFVYWLLAGRRA
ncbi:MAG: hypothetical protein AB1749_15250 [Pseudomonadota bacterium]